MNTKELNQEKKCVSNGICYTSIPAQSKCKFCGQFWFEGKEPPMCGKPFVPEEKCCTFCHKDFNTFTCDKTCPCHKKEEKSVCCGADKEPCSHDEALRYDNEFDCSKCKKAFVSKDDSVDDHLREPTKLIQQVENTESKEKCYNCDISIKFDGKMPLCENCLNRPKMDYSLPTCPPHTDSKEVNYKKTVTWYAENPLVDTKPEECEPCSQGKCFACVKGDTRRDCSCEHLSKYTFWCPKLKTDVVKLKDVLFLLTHTRQEERMRAFEILHKYAMQTKDTVSLDLIEKAQQEIINNLTQE